MLRFVQNDSFSEVREHIREAARKITRKNYSQEPAYVTALLARLIGSFRLKVNGIEREITFIPTVVNDRGRNSAESITGADFSIVFNDTDERVNKAILGQAKNGDVSDLTDNELIMLGEQCEKMNSFTNHWIVLEAPEKSGSMPMIRIGNNDGTIRQTLKLDDYIVDYVIACLHGDHDLEFVENVQDSALKKLIIEMRDL
ncbi:hypothetical protein [Photobacterium minamisatsumaniensis]|uniref:hypothetical protein n=1 Tax=Photobacterium minamisatsumaniensis TaxID=2910233 RepID=UPI003D0968AC